MYDNFVQKIVHLVFNMIIKTSAVVSRLYVNLYREKAVARFPLLVCSDMIDIVTLYPLVVNKDVYLLKNTSILIIRKDLDNPKNFYIILDIDNDKEYSVEDFMEQFPDSSDFFLFNLDLFR